MTFRIFVGFDHRQPVAYNVCQMSILRHATKPVSITPLILPTLPIKREGLTPFTFSRFLVPWLCDYSGQALFMDSDFLARSDVTELFRPTTDAVSVVKHERTFERPSLMLFNCDQCEVLTPQFVESSKGIMRLEWADSVGDLAPEWNHLVGYDKPNPKAKLVHFTQGLPCYREYPKLWNAEFGQEWRDCAKLCTETQSWETLMGTSVHVQYVKETADV